MKELMLKKCNSCGAIVKVLEECHCPCDIMCCEEKMQEIKANSVDASFEKHVPSYEISDGKIKVTVNHVMEEDHYLIIKKVLYIAIAINMSYGVKLFYEKNLLVFKRLFIFLMVALVGFGPTESKGQSLLPYHLAIGQYI